MRSLTTATIPSLGSAARAAHERRFARLVGLAIASLAPALFWIVVIEMVAHLLGTSVSPATMAMTGVTIAAFLFAVCAPLMLRSSRRDDQDSLSD